MTDFHTHILPGIDDGSKDMDMTEQMLEAEMQQGVSHIFATPHFYAHRRSVDSFLDRRSAAMDKVRKLLESRPELPRVTAGAEVYYFAGIGKSDRLPDLCIDGSDILLLEMPFGQWHSSMLDDIEDILCKRRLRLVMAHLDRYEHLQKDRRVWDRVMDMPLTIQLNCEPIINSGSFFRKNHDHKFCFEVLSEYSNCIIGSDCHNITDRAPNISKARKVIEEKAGAARLKQLDTYTEELLGGL